MPKGIILRIPIHLKDKLPSNLRVALDKRFPGRVKEYYSEQPDYRESYAKRVDILYQAFEFLLDSYPLSKQTLVTKETLKAHAAECKSAYIGQGDSVSDLQQELKKFTADIIDAVAVGWNQSPGEATELLNEAEQYVLMTRGRDDLVTLSAMDLGKGVEYILQYDESLPPYDEKTLKELQQIKKYNAPKTPEWFRELAKPEKHFKQAYFCKFPGDFSEVVTDFTSFLDKWEEAKSSRIEFDLKYIAKRAKPLPAWFDNLPTHQRAMVFVLANEPVTTIDGKLKEFKKMLVGQAYQENFAQMAQIPQWYWVLPEHQQYFLGHALKSKETVEEAVSFLPSRERTVPLTANLARHSAYIATASGELRLLYAPKYRSSHIATRDGAELKWPEAVLRRHYKSNLKRVMADATSEQLALMQTLVSPVGSVYLPGQSLLSGMLPDYMLDQMASTAIADRIIAPLVVKTNHPLNKAKLFLYTTANDPAIIVFLEALKEYAYREGAQINLPAFKELLKSYMTALNSPMGSATIRDYVGRELWLSSVEHLLIHIVNGYSYGSCVSGKDRKAIEIIHTDAMFLYKEKYGIWAQFADVGKSRANFVSLVAELYLTRHQHEHAGQNAPGSEGLKTPDGYFPPDIVAEINRRLSQCVENDDRLATNNEVRKISTGNGKNGDLNAASYLLCKLTARELGENRCTQFYDTLYKLLFLNDNMEQFIPAKSWTVPSFISSSEPTLPEGLKQIKKLMKSPDSGVNNVTRIQKILAIIFARPDEEENFTEKVLAVCKGKRTDATLSVYNGALSLLNPIDNGISLDVLASDVLTKWESLAKVGNKAQQMVASH